MSTYKRAGAQTYSYDFQYRGHRFSGDTGQSEKRAADQVEKIKRDAAKRQLRAGEPIAGSLTFEAAAARYWHEVAQHHTNNLTDLGHIEWLTNELGHKTLLRDIDDNRVALLVAKRRAEPAKAGRNRGKPLSPATINRTATEPLRKIMLRAQKVWKMKVGDVQWAQHMLKEPKERVREASLAEEQAVMAHLDRGYGEAVIFTLINGLRRMETIGLQWSHVDFFSREFTVIGKGNKPRTIPMSDRAYQILWAEKNNHPSKVFTYVAQRTDKRKGIGRGLRYPITDAGLKTAWRRACDKANVTNLRFHDLRHTGATRLLRANGNLRLVQQLLGHEDIATTTKYAHVTKEDLRTAMNATSPTQNPTQGGDIAANGLNNMENET